jgi:hypothetical protein
MLRPLRRPRSQVSVARPVPAPVAGWNAKDSIAQMKPNEAYALENYFPTAYGIELRGGTRRHATLDGVTTSVQTLMTYASGSIERLLAAAGGKIFNVSAGGTISTALASGFTSDRYSYANMNGYLVFVNGTDSPQKYDGSTVSATTITGSGLTASNLSYVVTHKQRLFFIEKETLSAWYLGTNSIAGTASQLDFSGYCKKGGKLVAIGTWTRDGGSGSDDLIVFVTSKGQALIYEGTDPSSANTWSLIGVFDLGTPIGERPFVNFGSDLILICTDGFIPLSKVLPIDRVGAERVAISDNIRTAVNDAAQSYSSNFGWEGIVYPETNYVIFNIPTIESRTAIQFVMNAATGAWCKFTDINAVTWGIYNNRLYFGANNGFVVQAATTPEDDTLAATQAFTFIVGNIRPSFQYFGAYSTRKHFKMARILLRSNAPVSLNAALEVDFKTSNLGATQTSSAIGTPWGSPWGSPWSNIDLSRSIDVGAGSIGACASLHIKTSTRNVEIVIDSFDYFYEVGGLI